MAILNGKSVAVEMLNEGRGKDCRLKSWRTYGVAETVTGATFELHMAPAKLIERGTYPGYSHGADQAVNGRHIFRKVLMIPSDTCHRSGKRCKN
jgi:hypothetical protein